MFRSDKSRMENRRGESREEVWVGREGVSCVGLLQHDNATSLYSLQLLWSTVRDVWKAGGDSAAMQDHGCITAPVTTAVDVGGPVVRFFPFIWNISSSKKHTCSTSEIEHTHTQNGISHVVFVMIQTPTYMWSTGTIMLMVTWVLRLRLYSRLQWIYKDLGRHVHSLGAVFVTGF